MIKKLLCKIGLHKWKEDPHRYRRYKRTCTRCGIKQTLLPEYIGGGRGGSWTTEGNKND